MELVIHGIDLTAVAKDRRNSFLNSLASRIRIGMGKHEANLQKTNSRTSEPNYNLIQVAFDEGSTPDTLNVRAMIPVTEMDPALNSAAVRTLMGNLEKDLVKTDLEDEVRLADGVKLLSTWTTDAIKVSTSGHIDDFAGDVIGDSDVL